MIAVMSETIHYNRRNLKSVLYIREFEFNPQSQDAIETSQPIRSH